jgi:hypothetical protein
MACDWLQAPNFMMMRFASRKSKLSKLNKQAKQVMTGAPVSRHIPGTLSVTRGCATLRN